jgi:D-arabinose 1-dehydrogenase-like Zn-dependent alcohol dehydrogenase
MCSYALLLQVSTIQISTHGRLGIQKVRVVAKMPAGRVSRSISRAFRGPLYLEVLRPGGRYAVAGAIAGPLVELDVRTLYLKDLSLFGCTVLEPEVFSNLIKRIEQGAIAPVVARSFALEEIRDAQSLFLKKQHVGKIVLRI